MAKKTVETVSKEEEFLDELMFLYHQVAVNRAMNPDNKDLRSLYNRVWNLVYIWFDKNIPEEVFASMRNMHREQCERRLRRRTFIALYAKDKPGLVCQPEWTPIAKKIEGTVHYGITSEDAARFDRELDRLEQTPR